MSSNAVLQSIKSYLSMLVFVQQILAAFWAVCKASDEAKKERPTQNCDLILIQVEAYLNAIRRAAQLASNLTPAGYITPAAIGTPMRL